MITKNLYKEVLINPINKDVDELYIVSGFASATFCRRNLEELLNLNNKFKLNLIIGMSTSRNDQFHFKNLSKNYPNSIKAYYYIGKPSVHSKVYSWTKNNNPLIGFSGSANYSQYGFFSDMQENQMIEDNAKDIYDYFRSLLPDSISIEEFKNEENNQQELHNDNVFDHLPAGQIEWVEPNRSVRISLLDVSGNLPKKSGLNWGQRPDREPNQAYLSVKKDARKEGFLPEKGFTFSLMTDDKVAMDCVVQQDNRKAISTTNNNSDLGKYFRNRLGVEEGKIILKDDLIKYGRTDFILRKIDDETFMLDFSKT